MWPAISEGSRQRWAADHFEVEIVTGLGGAKSSEPFLAELANSALA